jgi:pilus assembly protein FimV
MGEGGGAEVATKLDLARAYVEMGDKEGAKEILEEVLKEGNSQQQADANQLLASL